MPASGEVDACGGESVTAAMLIGGGLIIAGVWLTIKPPQITSASNRTASPSNAPDLTIEASTSNACGDDISSR